jgi:ABC-type transport system involved in multi-copper enzyme maturation permease subunit
VSAAVEPYRSPRPGGPDGFLQLLHAEWTKFRTVRAWMVGTVVGGLVIVLMAWLTGSLSHSEACISTGNGPPTCHTVHIAIPVGPGGEPVTDEYSFLRQTLPGKGSITVRVTSLTGLYASQSAAPVGSTEPDMARGVQPWSKAGVIVTATTRTGSPYAAIMVTGTHGVRLQDDYTRDVAGMPGAVSATSPRWLRLTRAGDTITGFDSTDGNHWTTVGSVHLASLPATVQVGMFATSPEHLSGDHSGTSVATGVFDHVTLQGGRAGGAWRGTAVGQAGFQGPISQGTAFRHTGGAYSVTGSGDIAPAVVGTGADPGRGVERTLIGAFVGLIVLTVVATLFITGEYRRGLVRTTFTASPRRHRVLAAKAVVIGGVVFAAGLAGAGIALPLGARELRANGSPVYPTSTAAELRAVVGTAALLAVAAVLALAVGTILRRSAPTVTAIVVTIVLPYILAVASVLPAGPAEWLLRVTPAAAFSVQQTLVRYPQVNAAYRPVDGYFPLAPWAGFAVLCGYTLCAMSVAMYLLRRRDV